MSADLLRRAAAALRQHAEQATPGPWRYNPAKQWLVEENPVRRQLAAFLNRGEEFVGAGPLDDTICVASTGEVDEPESVADARFIALMHPPVAVALADLLDVEAEVADVDVLMVAEPAYRLARAILREERP